jgi:hypothetical protein
VPIGLEAEYSNLKNQKKREGFVFFFCVGREADFFFVFVF